MSFLVFSWCLHQDSCIGDLSLPFQCGSALTRIPRRVTRSNSKKVMIDRMRPMIARAFKMVLKKGELVCILIFVMQIVARRSTIHERHANAHRFRRFCEKNASRWESLSFLLWIRLANPMITTITLPGVLKQVKFAHSRLVTFFIYLTNIK